MPVWSLKSLSLTVLKQYFVRHYPEPIYENGIECRDMVRLRMEL